MPEIDFAGLRTAVQDAAERAPFDRLVERAAVRRRRRRAGAGLGLLCLALVALATATGTVRLRSDRGPATPLHTEDTPYASLQLLDAAFAAQDAYALVGTCATPDEAVTCQYVLAQSRDAGKTWQVRLHRPLRPLETGEGFSAELLITGPDQTLAIVDEAHGRVYRTTDRTDTFAVAPLRTGPPVAALPETAAVRSAWCEPDRYCPAAVSALDPTTGITAPLRNQPPLGVPITAFTVDDRGGLWVGGAAPDRTGPPVIAYSADRGRSWRLLPVPPERRGVQSARVYPLPGGHGAYLIGARHDRPDVKNDFADLWRIGDPTAQGAAWARITPARRPASASSAVGLSDGSLLLTEEAPGASPWRVAPTGEIRRVQATASGIPVRPAAVHRGPGSLIYGPIDVSGNDLELLVSDDDGRTWRRSVLPNP